MGGRGKSAVREIKRTRQTKRDISTMNVDCLNSFYIICICMLGHTDLINTNENLDVRPNLLSLELNSRTNELGIMSNLCVQFTLSTIRGRSPTDNTRDTAIRMRWICVPPASYKSATAFKDVAVMLRDGFLIRLTATCVCASASQGPCHPRPKITRILTRGFHVLHWPTPTTPVCIALHNCVQAYYI